MKNDVSWGLKNILLPLSPFLLGALFKWLYEGSFSFGVLDSGRLSFSMAILCILLLKSASQLDDTDLSDALTSVLGLGVILYLALFATASFIQIHIDHQTIASLNKVKSLLHDSPLDDIGKSIYNRDQDLFNKILKRMSVIIVVLACITIPLTILSRRWYNLK